MTLVEDLNDSTAFFFSPFSYKKPLVVLHKATKQYGKVTTATD